MTAQPRSLVGQRLTDARGRVLRVDEVHGGDPLGREIVGTLLDPRNSDANIGRYATTAATFKEIWIERTPPTTREQQEANRKRLGV